MLKTSSNASVRQDGLELFAKTDASLVFSAEIALKLVTASMERVVTEPPEGVSVPLDGAELIATSASAPRTNTARIAIKLANVIRLTMSRVIRSMENASASPDITQRTAELRKMRVIH